LAYLPRITGDRRVARRVALQRVSPSRSRTRSRTPRPMPIAIAATSGRVLSNVFIAVRSFFARVAIFAARGVRRTRHSSRTSSAVSLARKPFVLEPAHRKIRASPSRRRRAMRAPERRIDRREDDRPRRAPVRDEALATVDDPSLPSLRQLVRMPATSLPRSVPSSHRRPISNPSTCP
jgi:hypothetical protein